MKSKVYWWGHIQLFGGAIVTSLGYFNHTNFPDYPAWAYGLAAMLAGLITYALRELTKESVGK